MKDTERTYYNVFVAMRNFGVENAADFPADSVGAESFALCGEATDKMEQAGATQTSGASGQATVQKGVAIAGLREDLQAINRTARGLAVDDESVGELFRMPHGNNEQNLLAVARAFLTNATPLKAQFIKLEMPADFLEDLQIDIAAFEKSVTEKGAKTGEKVSAIASIDTAMDKGLKGLRRLRAIVPNKYRSNSAKIAAWTSASHIERAAKKKYPETPLTQQS